MASIYQCVLFTNMLLFQLFMVFLPDFHFASFQALINPLFIKN